VHELGSAIPHRRLSPVRDGLGAALGGGSILARPEWLERYRTRIPVLRRMADGRELDWPFDRPQLLAFYRETE